MRTIVLDTCYNEDVREGMEDNSLVEVRVTKTGQPKRIETLQGVPIGRPCRISEACEILNLKKRQVQDLAKRGILQVTRKGNRYVFYDNPDFPNFGYTPRPVGRPHKKPKTHVFSYYT